jgi:uncharacterized protein (TIGR02300 family)
VGELGTRFKCFKCETKFYDLGRPLPICPSCGEDQNNRETMQVLKRKRKRSSIKMEPDIHILPEEHDPLADHAEHDAEEHEGLTDADNERSEENEDEDSEGKADKDLDEDGDEYGSH